MAFGTAEAYQDAQIGKCLVQPLQRTSGKGFSAAKGERLLRAALQQILGTRHGELPWRPAFGLAVEPERHKNLTEALASAVASDVVEALTEFEPRVSVIGCNVDSKSNRLRVSVSWQVETEALGGNAVSLGPVSQEVAI